VVNMGLPSPVAFPPAPPSWREMMRAGCTGGTRLCGFDRYRLLSLTIGRSFVLLHVFFVFCFIVLAMKVESVFLSAAATLSSTAMVTEFVAHSRLGDTVFARMVVDLVAVQDLIM